MARLILRRSLKIKTEEPNLQRCRDGCPNQPVIDAMCLECFHIKFERVELDLIALLDQINTTLLRALHSRLLAEPEAPAETILILAAVSICFDRQY